MLRVYVLRAYALMLRAYALRVITLMLRAYAMRAYALMLRAYALRVYTLNVEGLYPDWYRKAKAAKEDPRTWHGRVASGTGRAKLLTLGIYISVLNLRIFSPNQLLIIFLLLQD